MKSLLCALILALAATSIKAQAGNYLLQSYNAAVVMRELYETQVNYYRDVLTGEAWDMGRVFTEQMLEWTNQAQSEAEGAALRNCAAQATTQCQEAIDMFGDRLEEAQTEADLIHVSVYNQLIDWNVKSEEFSLFYYYHTQRMDESLAHLRDFHVPRLQEAYQITYDRWFEVYYSLRECATAVLGN